MTRLEAAQLGAQRIDPRGPRFGAALTATLLFIATGLAIGTGSAGEPAVLAVQDPVARILQPAPVLLLVVLGLFVWGASAGIRRHPFGILYARWIRPRLPAPRDLEPSAPPTFAQGVGAAVVGAGLVLHALGVPFALPIAAAAAFLAAFLNAAFGFCLGCELYLVLRRLRPRRA